MSSFLGNLISGPLNDALSRAQKAAPAQIDKALTSAGTTITGSSSKATNLFSGIYTSATAKIAAWLPTTRTWALSKVNDLIVKAKLAAGKL
jgi:hypothetical protein